MLCQGCQSHGAAQPGAQHDRRLQLPVLTDAPKIFDQVIDRAVGDPSSWVSQARIVKQHDLKLVFQQPGGQGHQLPIAQQRIEHDQWGAVTDRPSGDQSSGGVDFPGLGLFIKRLQHLLPRQGSRAVGGLGVGCDRLFGHNGPCYPSPGRLSTC